MPTPYEILGVGPLASAQVIRQAYRRRVQAMHPDRAGQTPEVHGAFLQLQHAYRLLSDARQRAALDARLRRPPSPPPRPAAPPRSAPPPPPARPMRVGDALRVTQVVPWAQWYAVTKAPVSVRARVAQTCPRCQGMRSGCLACRDTGQVWAWRAWQIQWPAGLEPGQAFRLPQQGHMGPHFDQPGDVWVTLTAPRRGPWRWANQRMEAALAWRKGAPPRFSALRLPDGRRVRVRVPDQAQPGQWVRVAQLGCPMPSGGRAPLWLHLRRPWWRWW